MTVQWTLHETYEASTGEGTDMYAIIPNDDTNGMLVGEMPDVVALYQTLKRFIEDGIQAERLDDLDEQLGFKWLSVSEISRKYQIPVSTVRTWPPRIAGSVKQSGRWYMPEVRVRSLVIKWEKRKLSI